MAISYSATAITINSDFDPLLAPVVLPPTASAAEVELAASQFAPPVSDPSWHDFSMALMTNIGVNAMLEQVLQSAPGLFGGLTIGLKNASDGDNRAFISSWQAAHKLNLLPQSIVDDVLELAAYHHLPAGFIAALHLS